MYKKRTSNPFTVGQDRDDAAAAACCGSTSPHTAGDTNNNSNNNNKNNTDELRAHPQESMMDGTQWSPMCLEGAFRSNAGSPVMVHACCSSSSSSSSSDVCHLANPLLSAFPDVVGASEHCRYKPLRSIGRGAYSTVWALEESSTGQAVVGKFSDLTAMTETNKALVLAEAENTAACQHPNIIRLFGTYAQSGKVLHILEYADAGDLGAQITVRANAQKKFRQSHPDSSRSTTTTTVSTMMSGSSSSEEAFFYEEHEVLMIFTQLCLAMLYLHERRIMHRDLKTSNVMLTRSGIVKIGDFGLSRQLDGGDGDGGADGDGDDGNNNKSTNSIMGTFCGTPYYLAPELWRRLPYNDKADVWSLGIILYELLTLTKPFLANDYAELMKRVLHQGSYDTKPLQRYSEGLQGIVKQMLLVDPSERPSMKDILRTEYMQKKGLPLYVMNVGRLSTQAPDDVALLQRIVDEAESLLRHQ